MKALNPINRIEFFIAIITVVLILFWLYAAGTQISDFNKFKGEMNNQVFSGVISNVLAYLIPVLEITIAGLLVYSFTRLWGMIFSFSLLLVFSTYVGLALLNVFSRMPCTCAGLLGGSSTWEWNLTLNLIVTAVAAAGLILNLKWRRKEGKGMDAIVSHAPLPA